MDFEGHVSTGLATSTAAAVGAFLLFEPIMSMHVFVASMIFSLYPDMDTGSISRRVLHMLFTVAVITLYKEGFAPSAIGVLTLMIIPSFFKHRGFTHTVFGMLFFVGIYYTSVGYCIGFEDLWPVGVAGILGYLTHLASDM